MIYIFIYIFIYDFYLYFITYNSFINIFTDLEFILIIYFAAPPVNIYSNYSTVTDISAYGTLPAPAYGTLPVHSPKYSPALGGTYRPASPANGAFHPPSPQHLGGGYTSARSALQENVCSIQGVSGSNVYGVPNPDLLWQEDVNVMEIPRENITVVEQLGQGQYGEVSGNGSERGGERE